MVACFKEKKALKGILQQIIFFKIYHYDTHSGSLGR